MARTREAYGTAPHPQAYPQASPLHPSYPAGHSTIAGACTAVLQALFDVDRPIEDPVASSEDGAELEFIDALPTVDGEQVTIEPTTD